MEQRKKRLQQVLERFVTLCVILLLINIGLLYYLRTQVGTIRLLRDQARQLTEDQRIVSSAEQLYEQYKDDIELVTQVFPDESTVLDFLQTLEQLVKANSTESSVKFASLTPLPENDKLFLLFTIAMKTDTQKLSSLLSQLESLPYMTHLLSVTLSWVDQKAGIVDVSMKLKLYVKNPFSAK